MADQIQVRFDTTEHGQHRVRLEVDGLGGFGIGDTPDEALTRALTGLSGAVRKRDWDTRRQKEVEEDTHALLQRGRDIAGVEPRRSD